MFWFSVFTFFVPRYETGDKKLGDKHNSGSHARREKSTAKLRLETLEDRCLPAASMVSASWAVVVPADLDGDGQIELVGRVQQSGNWWATRGNGSLYAAAPLGKWNPAHQYNNVQAADLFGDGRDEIIGRDATTGDWFALFHQQGQTPVQDLGNWPHADKFQNIQIADFKGDGSQQIVGWDNTTGDWHVLRWNGGAFEDQVAAHWNPTAGYQNITTANLFGGGLQEIVGRSTVTGDWHVVNWNGTAWQDAVAANWPAPGKYQYGLAADLFDDGRQEVVVRKSTTGQWFALSWKAGVYQKLVLSSWSTSSQYQFITAADINGDGKDDIVGRSAQSGRWWAVEIQNGVWQNVPLVNWSTSYAFGFVGTGDVDGDGKADLIGYASGLGSWVAAVKGGQRNILLGFWNPADAYQNVQFLDLNGDDKTDIFGVLPLTGAFWSIQSQGNGFQPQRLASWNTDFRKLPVTAGSDAGLVQLIQTQVPALANPALLGTLDEARLLRDWAANAVDWTFSGAMATQTMRGILKRSASDLYDNIFLTNQGGVFCGGTAIFFDKVLKLFGLDSFVVDMGDENGGLTHVTVVLAVGGQGSWSYYIMDPTFDGSFVTSSGRYVSVQNVLLARRNPSVYQFAETPIDSRIWIGQAKYKNPDLKLLTGSGNTFLYLRQGYQVTDFVNENAKALKKNGFSLKAAILPQLLDNEIFSVGLALDRHARLAFIRQMQALGIPVNAN